MATAKMELHLSLRDKLNMGLNAAKDKVNKSVGAMQSKLNGLRGTAAKSLGEIGNEVPQVGRVMSLLANPLAGATAGVLALGGAIAYSTDKALDWHKGMAEINVTAELSKDKLKGLSDKLLDIGGRNVAPLEEVPKAFQRIISAGLSVNDSLAALEPTLRAAKAGFSDIETVASAAISVMSSSGEEVNKVYDILFATVKSGNAEFKDIATYLPKIIPLAKNVGFALDETAGAYAALTTKLSAEQSSTALEGIMRSVSDSKVVGKFKKIGVDIFDFKTGKVKPILEIMKQLKREMTGLTDKQRMEKLGSLGLDQASSVGFSTLIQDFDGLKTAIDASVNSLGAMEKAYSDSMTATEKWEVFKNWTLTWVIKFGELFLPMVDAIGQALLDMNKYFLDLYKSSDEFRMGIDAIVWVFKELWRVVEIFGETLAVIIYGAYKLIEWLIMGIGWLIIKIKEIPGAWDGFILKVKPFLIWMKEFLLSIGAIMSDVFSGNFVDAGKKIANFKMPSLKDITAKVNLEAKTKLTSKAKEKVEIKEKKKEDADLVKDKKTTTPANPASPTNDAKVISGGGQAKNLTINIGSFIETMNTKNEEFNKMNPQELKSAMIEMFMGMLRSGELGF